MKQLYCIVGPTASGKTDYAIQLAKKLGTEIISADSRQIYQDFIIGTAQPSVEQLAEVPHHFIHSVSPLQPYNASDYEQEAQAKLSQLFTKYDEVVLCGGTGFYIQALLEGLDTIPEIPDELRQELIVIWQEKGLDELVQELQEKDPIFSATADLKNPRRVLRALEVIRFTGKTFSYFRTQKKKELPFQVTKIGLEMDRAVLYERIHLRMDQMLASGLLYEIDQLLQKYPRNINAFQTCGYQEFIPYIDGKISLEQAITLAKQHSRNYAKRQLTWFKKDPEISWINSLT